MDDAGGGWWSALEERDEILQFIADDPILDNVVIFSGGAGTLTALLWLDPFCLLGVIA